jgi:nucleotide-binding universal stress UspA family protein
MLQKILVAIDSSGTSEFVYEAALSLAKIAGSHLRVLHVVPPDEENTDDQPIYLTDLKPYTLDQVDQSSYEGRLFGKYVNQAIHVGIPTEFFQYLGDPGQIICNFALVWEADLIMMGHRVCMKHGSVVLGSVGNYVVRHAPCSVHIVHRSTRHKFVNPSDNHIRISCP